MEVLHKRTIIGTAIACAIVAVGAAFYLHSPQASGKVQEIKDAISDIPLPSLPIVEIPSKGEPSTESTKPVAKPTGQTPVAALPSPFTYSFNKPGTLYESGSMDRTSSPYFWLDSGGKLIIENGIGETVQGSLTPSDRWYKQYASENPEDTDGGTHPQNLFRLISRSTWENVRQDAQFKIIKDNLSESSNRNESNGLLLLSRYGGDGQTLYYTGVRVDGTAVIKKKYKGVYYTMAQKQIFSGTYTGSDAGADLIPHDQWIGLRSETRTVENGAVEITLYMQNGKDWQQLLTAKDEGKYGKTPPISGQDYVGIRTDFMDVQFDSFTIEKF